MKLQLGAKYILTSILSLHFGESSKIHVLILKIENWNMNTKITIKYLFIFSERPASQQSEPTFFSRWNLPSHSLPIQMSLLGHLKTSHKPEIYDRKAQYIHRRISISPNREIPLSLPRDLIHVVQITHIESDQKNFGERTKKGTFFA